MATKIIIAMLLIAVFASAAFAAVAEVLAPVKNNVEDGGSIYLGKIGPGQTIYINVNGKVTEGGKFGVGGTWQALRVLEKPLGWEGYDSKEMADEMQVSVKASPDAADGQYKVKLKLDEDVSKQQQLGSVTFDAIIDVDKNVMGVTFLKKEISVGVGQPARYELVIKNDGKANDVFEITSSGVPTWSFKKSVHVPAGKSVSTFYEFVSNEEKEYEPTITVASTSSSVMTAEQKVKLVIKSDLLGDIRATKNGVLVFPVILEPLYSLLGIISSFV